jgi:hypothetical protein
MGRDKCHSKPIIDKWIEDVHVDVWSNHKTLDMEKYGSDPTYENNYKQDIILLDNSKTRTNFYSIS